MLVEFVKNKRGKKIGAVVAVGPLNVGYSLCNKKDKFDKDLAVEIARGRAEVSPVGYGWGVDYANVLNVPHTVRPTVEKMLNRVKRYYKG
jgi:hypothetical protein